MDVWPDCFPGLDINQIWEFRPIIGKIIVRKSSLFVDIIILCLFFTREVGIDLKLVEKSNDFYYLPYTSSIQVCNLNAFYYLKKKWFDCQFLLFRLL